ncbi:MAG: chromate efflux transporter [Paracoccaceae bacterium]|nr:chromate efflux transporter [Paracoccaceae bacterium]
MLPSSDCPAAPPDQVTWHDLHREFARIGLLSFGGPAAQIALMHRMLVDERRWLSEADYLRALSFCMVLPGPEAMQLATYAGWRLRGVAGGLIAGLWFTLPGALAILLLAAGYVQWGTAPVAQGLLLGVKACVAALVVQALIRLAQRSLADTTARVTAALSFVALALAALPFPLVILAAALWGARQAGTAPAPPAPPIRPGPGILRRALPWAAAWLLPLGALMLLPDPFWAQLALFFSKLATLSFGGAYALLAWMAQVLVRDFGWLSPGEMIDALGLAETTPGPLILVTAFAGFVAGFHHGGIWAAMAGWAVTLWMVFTPCFLWVFAGAPLIEALTRRPRLAAALSGVSAAVVGVIAALALWFALHVLFAQLTPGPLGLSLPDLASFRPIAAALMALAATLLIGWRWPLFVVLTLCAGLGGVLGLGGV